MFYKGQIPSAFNKTMYDLVTEERKTAKEAVLVTGLTYEPLSVM
jgi:hypothetical protein